MVAITGDTFTAVANIGHLAQTLHSAVQEGQGSLQIDPQQFVTIHRTVKEIERVAKSLHLDATSDLVDDAIRIMARSGDQRDYYEMSASDGERLCWTLSAISRSFSSQMQSRATIVIDSDAARRLNDLTAPFGEMVGDEFPTCLEEISESIQCLAFKRNTACVFHLMRTMEIAVAEIAGLLGSMHSTDKEWGKLLSDIGRQIEAMPKGDARNVWSEVHALLYHVKQAWRNDTMHPKKTYTFEEAERVLRAVESFMTTLAKAKRQFVGPA